MDDTTQQSSEPSLALPAPKEKVKTGWGVPILFFLLVGVAGGFGAAGFWGWQQLTNLQNEQKRGVQQRDITEHSEQIKTLNMQLAALTALPAENQKLHLAIDNLKKIIKKETYRVNNLAEQMAKVTNHDEVDWQLAQLEHYTLLAHKRLKLTHDLPGAIALLDESISIAKEIDEPQALGIMQALESDKTTLSTVVDVNVEHVFIKIDEVIKLIDKLAMPQVTWEADNSNLLSSSNLSSIEEGVAEEPNSVLTYFTDVQGWEGYLDLAKKRVTTMLSSFVRIQTLNEPVKPLLPPEQRVYLQQNLQLILEQAQLSAMRRQGDNYNASLSQAQRWLYEYFRQDTPSAKYMHNVITELLALKVDLGIPEISNSIAAVKTFAQQWPGLKQKRQSTIYKNIENIQSGGRKEMQSDSSELESPDMNDVESKKIERTGAKPV